jgi:hypothetical protein
MHILGMLASVKLMRVCNGAPRIDDPRSDLRLSGFRELIQLEIGGSECNR